MALWTPEHINTGLWLDAADAATITLDGSNKLEQWADKSGNGRHATQNDAGSRPITGTLNGLAAIDFAGTANLLYVPRGFITDAYSAFVVYGEGGVGQRVLDQRSTGGAGTQKGWSFKSENSSSDVDIVDEGNGRYRIARDFSVSGTVFRAAVFPEGGDVNAYVNGEDAGNRQSNGNLPTDIDNTSFDIAVGGNADGSGTQDFTGKISEVILLPEAVSADVRQRIEGYLAHKWELELTLPSDHPYVSSPPEVFSLAGSVLDENSDPLQATVRVYRWDNGAFLAETETDPGNGTYSVDTLPYGGDVLVMMVPPSGYRPAAHGPITPDG